jgi:hypothetical protein
MRLTIIRSDAAVYVDSVSYSQLDISSVPQNVHALQWFDSTGWIEFNNGAANQEIAELPSWANACLQVWQAADYAAKNPPAPTPEELIQKCKDEARIRLLDTDYSELQDVKAILLNGQDFIAYRAAVRHLYLNPVVDPVWPAEPKAQWL